MGAYFKEGTVSIAVDAALSGAFYLGDKLLAEIVVPANTEGTNLCFQRSIDGVTYVDAYDAAGNYVTVPFTAGKSVAFDDNVSIGATRYIKIRTTDAAGTSTNQAGAAAVLTVKARRWNRI